MILLIAIRPITGNGAGGAKCPLFRVRKRFGDRQGERETGQEEMEGREGGRTAVCAG